MWDGIVDCLCPVCKERIGERMLGVAKEFFCSDCKWYYTFMPEGTITPTSQHKKDSKCGCGRCGR